MLPRRRVKGSSGAAGPGASPSTTVVDRSRGKPKPGPRAQPGLVRALDATSRASVAGSSPDLAGSLRQRTKKNVDSSA